MRTFLLFCVLSASLIISGCAGSASHDVLAEYEAKDSSLSCTQIAIEMYKAQEVIDAVAKDRGDLSGKDVVDGILWFPFNLIAKSGNYKKATEAAGKRIGRLEALKKEKCGNDEGTENSST